MQILDKIFGSATKVRLMRLFLLNPDIAFSSDEIVEKTMTKEKEVKIELAMLAKIGLIASQRRTWYLNKKFMYLKELQYFLSNANLIKHSGVVKKLQRLGKIKCIIIAGVFLNEWEENRLDLLIVGDEIHKTRVGNIIHQIEA